MWILEKPLVQDAINDIAKVISSSGSQINASTKKQLILLYKLYDRNNGTITETDDERINETDREILYNLYNKTYENQKLYYIRKALMKMVTVCPMCGIQPPSELDHQMPRSKYKSLSVCRLNLVPVCGVCNNKKNAKEPKDFIHPYYDHNLTGIPFFLIEIHSNTTTHRMSWKFSINEQIISDKILVNKVKNQMGVIRLERRLYKETNNLLSEFLFGAENWSQKTLDEMLNHEYKKSLQLRGMNDWHTVFFNALKTSPAFGIDEAKEYIKRHVKPFNNGVNA